MHTVGGDEGADSKLKPPSFTILCPDFHGQNDAKENSRFRLRAKAKSVRGGSS